MKSITLILIAATALFMNMQTFALSTDRDQPADIEADDIEFDFKKGIRTYKKNVLIVQGTLRIKADHLVTTYSADGELVKATAKGSLARFKQRPDDKPDDVEGWAKKIVVDQKKNILTLYGKAALKQGASTARGETIIYNMATDILKVKGGAKVGTAGANGQAAPARKLKDPFKDDPIPNSAPQTQTNNSNTAATKPNNNKQTSADKPPTKQAVETVPSGRSRLIIQPK